MKYRERFKCRECGLVMEGRLNPRTGLIYPYDRAPSKISDTVHPAVCLDCLHKSLAEVADVGTR